MVFKRYVKHTESVYDHTVIINAPGNRVNGAISFQVGKFIKNPVFLKQRKFIKHSILLIATFVCY